MKAILINDEQTVLDLLKEKITRLSNIEVIGAFKSPHRGLIEVSKQQPDVVFLDISIQEVNGVELARQLKQAMPEIKIVFLASFDEYAVEAFDIQAEDYLLKPVEDSRLEKTISRISEKIEIKARANQPMIGCFQKLHFCYYPINEDMIDTSWRTSKAREVFAYLIHKRGQLIRKDILVDMFWPESPINKAFTQLYSTIYQIRKSLETIEFDIQIISSEKSYRLELNNILVDVDLWTEGIRNMPSITADNIEAHKELLHLYTGAYFEEEDYAWSMYERERLRVEWINHLKRVVSCYYSTESYGEIILLYLYYQKINPFISESYFELMKLYAHFDNSYAVEEQYRLLQEMSEEELGEEPNVRVIAWYKNWKRNRKSNGKNLYII